MGYRSRQAMELGASSLLLSLLVNVSNSKLFLVETNSKEEIKNEVQDYGGADYGGGRWKPKVNGGWSAWGKCSELCYGFKWRTCTNPRPSNRGAKCSGSSTVRCSRMGDLCGIKGPIKPYFKYGEWSAWGSCSVTCGGGIKTRKCIGGANGGAYGCDGGKSWGICNKNICPAKKVDGGWSAWGSCTNPKPSDYPKGAYCYGPSSDRCNTNNCKVDGGWSAWGSCSKTCGGGTRKRSCTNPKPSDYPKGAYCYGSSSDRCNTNNCKVDGGCSAWGSCSKTCGGGTRKRSCTNPTPSYSPKGAYCYGSSSQSCINQYCKYY